MEERVNLALEIKTEELKGLCVARAAAHSRRAKVFEKRIERFAALARESSTVTVKAVAESADDLLDMPDAPEMQLSNASIDNVRHDIMNLQEHKRLHESAANWLRFVSEHLPDMPWMTFTAGSGIEFIAYLTDVSNANAMPPHGMWERRIRGVQ